MPFNRDRFQSMSRGFRFLSAILASDAIAPTYSGATIAPVGDGTDNGIAHLAFSETITSATSDYKTGFTLQSRPPAGTWTTITSWTGALHGDGDKIIVTLTGTVDTWQASHEFRLSYDSGVGNITDAAGNALASITDNAALTANNSTVDLLSGIVAWWAGADVNDSVGSNTLTNNNSVTFTAGKNATLGNAFTLNGTSQYLSIADNAAISIPIDTTFSLVMWLKTPSSLPSNIMDFIIKGGSTNEYELGWHNDTNRTYMYVFDNGADPVANVLTDLEVSTWYNIVGTYNDTTELLTTYVNAVSGTSVAATRGARDLTGTLRIGSFDGTSRFAKDQMQAVGIYENHALTAGEISDLYNSDNGKQFPFIPT